jgi:hypothetical protein
MEERGFAFMVSFGKGEGLGYLRYNYLSFVERMDWVLLLLDTSLWCVVLRSYVWHDKSLDCESSGLVFLWIGAFIRTHAGMLSCMCYVRFPD